MAGSRKDTGKKDWDDKPRTAKTQRKGDGATGAPQLRHGDKVRTTRGNLKEYPNATYGYQHMHLPPSWNGDKRKYATYLRKLKEWKEANGQGGTRRRRGSRSTRRR